MDRHPEEIMLELLQRQTEAMESIALALQSMGDIAQALDALINAEVETLPTGQTSITKAWE